MSNETELLPCPFCGGEAHTYKNNLWHVACKRAMHECVTMSAFVSEDEAIAAWNTRVHSTLTAEQVRECVQHVYYDGYNDGSVHKGHGIEETNWQAIADELNEWLRGKVV